MIRSLHRYLLILVMLATSFMAVGQNNGVPQPDENALELAFQKPERWTGLSYSHAMTFWERSYIMTGIGTDGIWGMSELFGGKTTGFYGSLDFGHWVAPIHGYEIGLSYGMLPVVDWQKTRFGTNYSESSYTRYFNIAASYMMNITSYAQKRERPGRWEWIATMGLDLRFQDITALGLHSSMRCQYNVTPEVGIYIEPKLGVYTNALDNEKVAATYPVHILPSISAGLLVRLERSEGYRRRKYVAAADRVRAYVAKHGTERSRVESIFGRRLNDSILADTVKVVEVVAEVPKESRADSLKRVFVMPTDSAGLAEYRADSLKKITVARADSVRRAVMLKDSLKQIAIMRKDAAGRAVLEADSLRRLEAIRVDSVMRAERAKAVADSLLQIEIEKNHKFHCGKVAVSTNMLYWAAAMPNVGLEVPLKNRYSVVLEYVCPWFANRSAGFSYRLLSWDLEGRYWFNNTNKLRGLYVGAYGSLGYYDFGQNDTGHQGNILSSAGLSAGYLLPLGKRVSLEMSMGFGVLNTTYSNYYEDDGYLVYASKHAFSIMGPTKATVGVTWSPEFDFKSTAMFNKSIRDENRVERAEDRVERDTLRARAAVKAQTAYEQEVEWRGERMVGKVQLKNQMEEKRAEDKKYKAEERAKEQAAAALIKEAERYSAQDEAIKARESAASEKAMAWAEANPEKAAAAEAKAAAAEAKAKEAEAKALAWAEANPEKAAAAAAKDAAAAEALKAKEAEDAAYAKSLSIVKAAADREAAKAKAAYEKEYEEVTKKNMEARGTARLNYAVAVANAKLAKAKGEEVKKVERVKPEILPLPKKPKAPKVEKLKRGEKSEAEIKAEAESNKAARQLLMQLDDMDGLL